MKRSLFCVLVAASMSAACVAEPEMGANGDKADHLEPDAGIRDTEAPDAQEPQSNDGYDDARDVNLAQVRFEGSTLAPDFYSVPDHGSNLSLGGTEFWQRFEGGEMPTFDFDEGTDAGRRCMFASAIRFSTIMADPPAEILTVLEKTKWSGSFFNWNDDFTGGTSQANGARLWAWKTHLIKWISQTDSDGTCHLPTLDMLVKVAKDCLETAEDDGEIQGCSAR